jgi:hypothetical protein
MILHYCQEALENRLASHKLVLPEGSILCSCAHDSAGMVRAYYRDGMGFLSRGDVPNALASFSYALGWLDAAVCLGLIAASDCGIPLLPESEYRPGAGSGPLREKTSRYHALLSRALESLQTAPEPDTCLSAGAARFLLVSEIFFSQGSKREAAGDDRGALAAYSYGFGWLDAGVRTGLFRVSRNRSLFTI